ncbi:TetR/AcrR family transcriptional regulator [Williamsia sterculiae]|uniref:TetR/AcrR family transcriptional regulator n=1 Tax=Williamsia sterculiae TaxID=1344003 RepID=UPI0009705204|nr:TetR/AcrR family transcriptional regulator [Williamsia sterculiae]
MDVVEDAPPGAELTVQDVASRSGLVRTVIQRHFGGRDGLVRATQAHALTVAFGHITADIESAVTLGDVVSRLAERTIAWVHDHPSLHVLIEREIGDGNPGELSLATRGYAEWLSQFYGVIVADRGADLQAHQIARVRLLFIGVVGQVRTVVAEWTHTAVPERLSPGELCDVLSDLIVAQIVSEASTEGVDLDSTTVL